MFYRKIYPTLEAHLVKKQATVLVGLRRVGKSTALKYLLEKANTSNKIYLDLERIENQRLFKSESYNDIERGIELQGFDFNQPGVIAIDEIQMSKNSSSVIKALYDKYGTKFIVTGSSSFYLKNHFSESLAGRKQIFELNPLDFEEFVAFKKGNTAPFKKEKWQTFFSTFYDLYTGYYEEYIQYGGFPEVVLATNPTDKIDYLKEILNAHIELDVKLLGDVSASDDLYKLIMLLANRVGSKVDYSKIAAILGINRNKIKEYILLLEYTYLIKTIKPLVKGYDKEITKQPKIYFTDTGMLQVCGQLSSGAIFENCIAQQLHVQGEVHYYEKSSGTEIDFILNKAIAIEVKETPTVYDTKNVAKRATAIGLQKSLVIGRKPAASGFADFIWGGNVV
jgi:hypothetical protein